MSESAKVSIVVPVYNEVLAISCMVSQLEPLSKQCQVVFVDGGSTDGTCEAVPPWAMLVRSSKGRGLQLNDGAAAATGDILVFLHADSIVPRDALEQVRSVLSSNDWGFFGIRFDDAGWLLRACAWWSNRRARRGVPFGDQGIFIWRDKFEQLGGFPNLSLMEDYQFSLNAREAGYSIGQARTPLVTSARRFGTGFFHQLKVIASMQKLRSRYRRGESPESLAQAYRDIR